MAGEYRSLKKQHYLNLIKKCASIGKNKQQWCSKNGIEYSTFMRWQALLRDEVADQVMEQQAIVPVKIAPLIVSTNNIVERTVKPFVMSCKTFLQYFERCRYKCAMFQHDCNCQTQWA